MNNEGVMGVEEDWGEMSIKAMEEEWII